MSLNKTYELSFWISGRLKDMLIINGVNFYPHDIEVRKNNCFDKRMLGAVR